MKKPNKKEQKVMKKIFKTILPIPDRLEFEPIQGAETLLKVAYGLRLISRRNFMVRIARLKRVQNPADIV